MKQHMYMNWNVKSEQIFVLNLDEKFDPCKNIRNKFLVEFERFTFAGGEPHFKLKLTDIPQNAELYISNRYNDVRNIFDILLAVDSARRIGFSDIHLVLPYFPAARQDRVCNEGEPLSIKVFADMINQCNFKSVHILSPHSEVTPALLNNVVVYDELKYVEEMLKHACPHPKDTTINIVCPDAGAGKRVQKVVQYLSNRFPQNTINLIRCEKVRDVKDGSLKEFFVQSEDLGGHPIFIIDDILSYGGTFKGLGEILRQRNCGELYLFTSHCDCVEGVQKMVEFFNHVYTTNSKKNWDDFGYTMDNKVTCYKFEI